MSTPTPGIVERLGSYVLTEEDVFDGKNRLGMNVRGVPLNVPLCCGCDSPLDEWDCSSCEEFQSVQIHGDPFRRRAAA